MGPPREKLILDAIHRLGGSWKMSKTGLTVKAWWVAFDLKVVPCRCSRISTFRFYTFVISVLHYLKHDVSLSHETHCNASRLCSRYNRKCEKEAGALRQATSGFNLS